MRASCIDTENSTNITRSASTTIASTVSLSRPRAPESATTAAVIVGENETTITTSKTSMTSRWDPTASGAMGNHGHASHATADRPTIATASVTAVMRAIAASRDPRRSTLNVRPSDERDQRRGDSRDHLKLTGHRLRDQIAQDTARR